MSKTNEGGASSELPFLIRFFDPEIGAEDARGRTLNDMVHFEDQELEMSHDYVQILFPLPEGSAFNWMSPIINKEVFETFRAQERLRLNFQRGFIRMMAFYGFDVTVTDSNHVELSRSESHKIKFRNWVVRMDHNHLRITRVIRSLRVLGLEAHAAAFYDAVLQVNNDFPNRIGARSMVYWKRAAKRPLYLVPDEDDDDNVAGQRFLIDYEAKKAKSPTEVAGDGGEGKGEAFSTKAIEAVISK